MSRSTLRIGIIVLGLITAVVHLVILNLGFILGRGQPQILFALNGLGYLALLIALFGGISFLTNLRTAVHVAFIAFTAVTILAWIFVGARSAVGYVDKIVEILLVVALYMHMRLGPETS